MVLLERLLWYFSGINLKSKLSVTVPLQKW